MKLTFHTVAYSTNTKIINSFGKNKFHQRLKNKGLCDGVQDGKIDGFCGNDVMYGKRRAFYSDKKLQNIYNAGYEKGYQIGFINGLAEKKPSNRTTFYNTAYLKYF